jgi:hypothetical protein
MNTLTLFDDLNEAKNKTIITQASVIQLPTAVEIFINPTNI